MRPYYSETPFLLSENDRFFVKNAGRIFRLPKLAIKILNL